MAEFDKVVVIYNPKSTNDAPKVAKEFAKEISEFKPELVATKRAGHAEELAREIASNYAHPLIISASGDGGYNEVVNGVMKAVETGKLKEPVVAVLPAGNANDHARTVHGDALLHDLIKQNSVKDMDLLKLTYATNNKTSVRYAHSYIGLGISAEAGAAINEVESNAVADVTAVATTLNQHTPFKIKRHGITRRIDSLIFANIPNMAKVLSIGNKLNVTDGLFEVHRVVHKPLFPRLVALLRMALPVKQKISQYSSYNFTLKSREKVQYDGEVAQLAANTGVTVNSVKHAIKTIRE